MFCIIHSVFFQVNELLQNPIHTIHSQREEQTIRTDYEMVILGFCTIINRISDISFIKKKSSLTAELASISLLFWFNY